MVELLASIVIMGLLAAVAIGAISFLLDTAEKRYYESLKKTVTLAGQSYYADNRSQLPKAIGDSRKVTLKTLIEKKYLENVLDYGKKDCAASAGSYIKVFKYAKDKYTYTVYLNCPSYKVNEDTYNSELKVTYKFNINSKNITASSVAADMSVTGDSKLASYTYTIYQNGKNVYTSGNISAGYVNKLSEKINLKKYVPGNIKVGITLYDTRGSHKLFMSDEKSIYDDTVPECGTVSPKYDSWTKTGPRKVTVKCKDDVVSCLQKSYSKNFTGDMGTGYITIKGTNADGSGRGERECPVSVMIDKTKPICGTNNGSTSWTKEGREISVACSDETSMCEKSSYSKIYDNTTKTSNITIKDKAGNTRDCPVNVYVDKSVPKCGTVTGASTTWINGNRTISVACSDSESGCNKASYVENFTKTAKTEDITIKDNVGNTKKCSVNVYIDKTSPTCGTVSGASKTWTNGNRTVSVACNDSDSGCESGKVSQQFTGTTKTANIVIKDKVGNSKSCPVDVYVDKVAPKCGKITGASTNWTSGNRTISVACSDSESGCEQGSYSKTFTGTTKTASIVIKDKAGNSTSCPVDVYVDKSAPRCADIIGSSTSWTAGSRPISVTCSDSESGCAQGSYSQNFTGNTKTASIVIKDKVGNSTSCPVNVYVDNTAPKCGTISGASTSWTNGNRSIGVACSDSGSGCVQSSFSQTFTATTKTSSIVVRDKAGNTASCPVNVYVDKTAPKCGTVTGASTSWTSNNRTISVACSDSQSGCVKDSYSQTFTTTTTTANIGIRDKAGNSANCSVNVYVDKSKNGWITEGSCKAYYENARKVTGWKQISGSWYYFDANGCMKTGWVQDKGRNSGCTSGWWYFDSNGKMATGWRQIGSKWYYMAKGDGKEGKWSGAKPTGCMYTGWVYSEDYTCDSHGWYFNDSGAMLSNTTVGGYIINSAGCWVEKMYVCKGRNYFHQTAAYRNDSMTLMPWAAVRVVGETNGFYKVKTDSSQPHLGSWRYNDGYIDKDCLVTWKNFAEYQKSSQFQSDDAGTGSCYRFIVNRGGCTG